MKNTNLPVPDGPVAPLNWRYFWYVAPPAALTVAYRAIPPRTRKRWALGGSSTSHLALREIIAGGGWAAFAAMAVPYVSMDKQNTWRGPVTGATWGSYTHAPSLGWKEDYGRGSSLENKELPDWFPTTHIDAAWKTVQPTGMRRIRLRDLLPLLITLRQPPGYPANPPPSLNWNGPKKK